MISFSTGKLRKNCFEMAAQLWISFIQWMLVAVSPRPISFSTAQTEKNWRKKLVKHIGENIWWIRYSLYSCATCQIFVRSLQLCKRMWKTFQNLIMNENMSNRSMHIGCCILKRFLLNVWRWPMKQTFEEKRGIFSAFYQESDLNYRLLGGLICDQFRLIFRARAST